MCHSTIRYSEVPIPCMSSTNLGQYHSWENRVAVSGGKYLFLLLSGTDMEEGTPCLGMRVGVPINHSLHINYSTVKLWEHLEQMTNLNILH